MCYQLTFELYKLNSDKFNLIQILCYIRLSWDQNHKKKKRNKGFEIQSRACVLKIMSHNGLNIWESLNLDNIINKSDLYAHTYIYISIFIKDNIICGWVCVCVREFSVSTASGI